jgi:hypothetical protein
MGGFSLFCLYYAGQVTDPELAQRLFLEAIQWGGLASIIVYCKEKYLI